MSARGLGDVVVVRAHPNIALAKYWGKRRGAGNFPSVPSLSVTLSGLATTTRLVLRGDLGADHLVLNGDDADDEATSRASMLLDRVRAASGVKTRAWIESTNDFPTASGLASSASGFAALAVAAVRAVSLDWDATRVSDLARRSSASAARSIFGGFVELAAGVDDAPEDATLAARPVAPVDQLPLRVLVCVTTESTKATSSGAGMRATAATSPYYAAWLDAAPKMHAEIRDALLARDFVKMGELAERSALAMHASAIAAGAIYWSGVTIEALAAVRMLRARGTGAFATIDAGPHVKVLVRPEDAALAGTWLRSVPGVLRVIECAPGDGAKVVEGDGEDGERDDEERLVIALAPGKLLLFGAYAVLEGGHSVVVAVDRHAVADDSRAAEDASREVRAAIGEERAPHVDVSALYDGGAKLGLGSSAAALVATLGVRAAARGDDLASRDVRDAIFTRARAAHAAAQSGGSGVDVAASTYGGALAYSMAEGARPLALAAPFRFVAFWSGVSARTSDLLARVASLEARDARAYERALSALAEAARHGIEHAGDVARLVEAGQATADALASLGRAADAPIVPPAFAELGALAEQDGGAFYPSGAGGGDVGVWIADHPPAASFLDRARTLGMRALSLGTDSAGVRIGRKD